MQHHEIVRKTWLLLTSAVLLAGNAAGGPIDNLQPGQWYQFPNSHIRDVVPNPLPEGNPRAIVYWSGGAFDSHRNRLIVFGGGHADYAGNELYAFDVAAGRWSRLTEPTAAPRSIHSYEQLEYLPRQDAFFAAGGSVWREGTASNETWLFDFASNSWRRGSNIPGNVYNIYEYNMTTGYDPVSDQVLMEGYTASASYSAATDTWTRHGSQPRRDLGHSGAFDTSRRQFVSIGRQSAFIYAVDDRGYFGPREDLNATGATEIQTCDGPGLEYDPVSDRMVAWCNGSDVYSLNLANRVWTRHTAANSVVPPTPPKANYHGTFGRWRYMPALNAFILATTIDDDVYAYKFTSGSGAALAAPSVTPKTGTGRKRP